MPPVKIVSLLFYSKQPIFNRAQAKFARRKFRFSADAMGGLHRRKTDGTSLGSSRPVFGCEAERMVMGEARFASGLFEKASGKTGDTASMIYDGGSVLKKRKVKDRKADASGPAEAALAASAFVFSLQYSIFPRRRKGAAGRIFFEKL